MAFMPYSIPNHWNVVIHKKAAKRAKKLPQNVQVLFNALIRDLILTGPSQYDWPGYSKLTKGRFHCHLNRGHVAVWDVIDNEVRILEVTYVGSREDAPY